MRLLKTFGVAVTALTAGLTGVPTSHAADWTPSRDIEFTIPYGPGGGFDTIVRKLSPYLEKELGGKVNVIPKNLPGASGSKAAIDLARTRPNGTKMMIFNIPGHALPNIKGDTKRYDLTKYTWLARIAKGDYVVVVSGKSGIKDFKGLLDLKRPVKNPELGAGGTSFMTSTIMWNTFGKQVNFITGYKSSADYALAVIRGDGDTTMLAVGSFRRYIGGGMKKKNIGPHDLVPVLELTTGKSVFGVKTAKDYGHPELDELGLERYVAAAPKTPANISSVLDAALKRALDNAEFKAWADKTGNGPIQHLDGKASLAAITKLITVYKKYADKF
jgi:tripartite-type tricarboxylate transporter receptor subunit TctC